MRAWSAGALALELEPSPRSARQARRWITDLCRKHDREDLVESAEAGVSELVSNALIHAPGPLSVRLSGTPAHPRVEVADSSSQPPRPQPALGAGDDDAGAPDGPDDLLDALLDDLSLLTYGRGLRIVAAGSVAWGAEVRRDGKVVWFEPAPELRAELTDAQVAGVVHLPDEPSQQPTTDGLEIRLPGVPVAAFARFRQHYRELRRELRLLALAHADDYPQAGRLSALLADFDRSLGRAIDDDAPLTALTERRRYAEVAVRVDADPEALAQAADTMQRLLDLADEFCSAVRLLTPARTPEQRRFTQWFLASLARRAAGVPAEPWEQAPGHRGWPDTRGRDPTRRPAPPAGAGRGGRWRPRGGRSLGRGRGDPRRDRLPVDDLHDQRHRLPRPGSRPRRPGASAARSRALATAFTGPGLLGGWTTLSAYAEQARSLTERGEVATAAAYVVGTLAACLAAVALGSRLARREPGP